MTASFRIALAEPPEDYLLALSRERWRREFDRDCARLEGTLQVFDPRALPVRGSGAALAAAAEAHPGSDVFPMDTRASREDLCWSAPPASTLRELDAASGAPPAGWRELPDEPDDPPARFRPAAPGTPRFIAAMGFRVFRIPDSFGIRKEILALIPPSATRLLDVGCGAGETAGEARRRIPGLRATGIDLHPELAEAARRQLDEFFPGDAMDAFAELARRNRKFDALLFADFLEHTVDPYLVLKASLRLADPGAIVIVSVPNASSLPIVQDLLVGRFDPVGAGPEDAGHLRWFTRRLLGELLESVGLRDIRFRPVPVPSDGTEFLARLRASGIAHAAEDLSAIQWLATAVAPGA